MPTNSLLMDLGNTCCKSRVLHQQSDEQISWSDIVVSDDVFQLLASCHDIDALYLASVRDDEFNQEIKQYCLQRSIEFHLIKTEQERFNLKNSYPVVSKMGVDRWLAMLGAQLFVDESYLVIDAGTAITCDAVHQQQHIGGWIAPGYALLREAVTKNTARVTQSDIDDSAMQWGQDTEACLHYGCLAQMLGLVTQATALMQNQHSCFKIVISGGDAEKLRDVSFDPSHQLPLFISNIVMYGLLRYALSHFSLDELQSLVGKLQD